MTLPPGRASPCGVSVCSCPWLDPAPVAQPPILLPLGLFRRTLRWRQILRRLQAVWGLVHPALQAVHGRRQNLWRRCGRVLGAERRAQRYPGLGASGGGFFGGWTEEGEGVGGLLVRMFALHSNT